MWSRGRLGVLNVVGRSEVAGGAPKDNRDSEICGMVS